MDVYMNNLLCAAQGHPYQKHRVPKLTIRALNYILLYIPDEVKYLASLKKVLDGDSNWARVKEILGWVIYTHRGTLDLSSTLRLDIFSLLAIPTTQQQISANNLECLISKLRSMRLAVLGGIGRFYAMQFTLTHA